MTVGEERQVNNTERDRPQKKENIGLLIYASREGAPGWGSSVIGQSWAKGGVMVYWVCGLLGRSWRFVFGGRGAESNVIVRSWPHEHRSPYLHNQTNPCLWMCTINPRTLAIENTYLIICIVCYCCKRHYHEKIVSSTFSHFCITSLSPVGEGEEELNYRNVAQVIKSQVENYFLLVVTEIVT